MKQDHWKFPSETGNLKKGRVLEFSLQCDQAFMIGFIPFAILINVEKSHYRDVCEHMYREFQEKILYHPSIVDPDDRLIFVLFAESVNMIDFISAKVNSFKGVKNADVCIPTKLQYYDDWIISEIDERILPQQPLSHNR